jgi:sugar lactone lactonase YvrE
LLGKIEVPALNVTSCEFGGPDLKTLLITTAREGLNEEQLQRYPLSGQVFYVHSPICGIKSTCWIRNQ